MAIYRPRRARWPWLVAVALVSFVAGVALGAILVQSRGPDLPAAAAEIHEALSDSAGLLEVVQIEYREAQAAGAGSTEYEGARDALTRSRARFDAVAPALAMIDGPRAARIQQGFGEVAALIDRRAEAAEVESGLASLRQDISAG